MPPLFLGVQLDMQSKAIVCFWFPINAIKKQQIHLKVYTNAVWKYTQNIVQKTMDFQ